MALVLPDRTEAVEIGELRGRLLRAPQGEGGFGYDPLFVADGRDVSNAELAPADKDAISHRGRALRAIVPAVAAALLAPRPDSSGSHAS
jgi:XTP/dITP diphosphohydrolase